MTAVHHLPSPADSDPDAWPPLPGTLEHHSHPLPALLPSAGLSWAEVLFTGWAGLRGAISLILNADFIAHRCQYLLACWLPPQRSGSYVAVQCCGSTAMAAVRLPVGRCPCCSQPVLMPGLQLTSAGTLRPPAAHSCKATRATRTTRTGSWVRLKALFCCHGALGEAVARCAPPGCAGLLALPLRLANPAPAGCTDRQLSAALSCRSSEQRHCHLDLRLCAAHPHGQRALGQVRGHFSCSAPTWLPAGDER